MKLSLKKLLSKILEYLAEDKKTENRELWVANEPKYMIASHEITLNEPVSSQKNGIVLIWSYYNKSTGKWEDWGWQFQYVPKDLITLNASSNSGTAWTGYTTRTGNTICNKYLYIFDTYIKGHADNSATGTGYNNSFLVLRKVVGV